ncbi:hypothetical protein [uncultured Parvibaculum sp.]|uniref:hypothetical protein n=1 Tax=uncultured Parvibaculum sp. TaxID=291828 RepID=UPI0030D7C33F|tara:strand:- start:55902 stop:56462 length:561 start_codon:yes stop_codon:yes gene_type:complete
MRRTPLRVTLDTNCLINSFDDTSATATSLDDLRKLLQLARDGIVEIAVTTRVKVDLQRDADVTRRAEMLSHASQFQEVGTLGRWGVSTWGGGDFYVGDAQIRQTAQIQGILFPNLSIDDKRRANKMNDVDHLFGHLRNSRDVFVTDDGGILRKSSQLKEALGIVVMCPAECVSHIVHVAMSISDTQ